MKDRSSSMLALTLVLAAVGCSRGAEDQVVGTLAAPLDARKKVVGIEAAPVGELVADAMLEAAQGIEPRTKLALLNASAIGFDAVRVPNGVYGPGELRRGDLRAIARYNNQVELVSLSGAKLRSGFERGVSAYPRPTDRFLHVSKGVRVVFDPSRPAQEISVFNIGRSLLHEGKRVTRVTIDGEPLRDDAQYTVALIDYLASGRAGFLSLTTQPLASVGPLVDVLQRYVAAHSPIEVRGAGTRVTAVPSADQIVAHHTSERTP